MFFIKKLKACFQQGENNKRYKVLNAITEAIKKEYTEDNYYTRLYWLVEEILISDPDFCFCLDDQSIECIKRGLADVVDKAAKRKKPLKVYGCLE
jgi:hypothetical protein